MWSKIELIGSLDGIIDHHLSLIHKTASWAAAIAEFPGIPENDIGLSAVGPRAPAELFRRPSGQLETVIYAQ